MEKKELQTELTSNNPSFVINEEDETSQYSKIDSQPDYILVFKHPKFFTPAVSKREDREIQKDYKSQLANLFIIKAEENPIIKEAIHSLSDDPQRPKISKSDFIKFALDTILKVIQDSLGIYTEAYLSSNKDEILISLKVSDINLQIQADLTDYKLQISEKSSGLTKTSERFEFQSVLPYAPLEKNIVDKNPNAYLKYNAFDNPDKLGSMFRGVDRIRLVKSLLSDTIFFHELYDQGMIVKEFPIHNHLILIELRKKWANFRSLFSRQPLDLIRNYFGEEITFYFAYLGMYSKIMAALSVLGIVFFVLIMSGGDILTRSYYVSGCMLAFALVQGFISIFFDQFWIREENYLKWKWGVDKLFISEEQQQKFKGERKLDEVSGKIKTIYSAKGLAKYAGFMGYGLILFCVMIVVSTLVAIFLFKDKYYWGVYVGGLLNGIQIKLFNQVYKLVATKMTDWENLETNRDYFDSLTFKLFCFEFVNSYSSLLYIAFLKNNTEGCYNGSCLEELRFQLLGIFFFNFITNGVEVGYPYIKNATLFAREKRKANSFKSIINDIEKEAILTHYASCLYEYMEIAIDYGYVLLFSTTFQLLPIFALIMALVEIRIDAWKLCYIARRPFPKQANTIGIWNQIIQTLSVIGICVNIGIVVFTYDGFFLEDSDSKWILFIAVEHFLIVLKLIISELIPDEPLVVKQGLIWSGRIVRDQIFHINSDDEKKSILASNTVDPERIVEVSHIFN